MYIHKNRSKKRFFRDTPISMRIKLFIFFPTSDKLFFNGSQKSTGTKVKSRVTREDVINKNITIHKIIHLLSLFKIEISFNKYEFIC